MIPILYESTLQDMTTTSNGICRLADCTSCVVTEERNGEYTLTLKMPFKGRHANELKVDRIIKATANDTSKPQCFRIVKISKDMKGMALEVLANHISYDLSFVPVRPFSATATGRKQAFELLWANTLENNPFTYEAPDDALVKKIGPGKPTSLRSLLGGVEGSILDLFGGEYEFDNRKVIWHLHRGADNGVTIRYGKNLTSYEQEENIAETVCGIIPYYAMEDTVIYGDIQYCENADRFAVKRTVPYDFTMSYGEDEVPTVESLNAKARSYINGNSLGVPDVSIHVEFRQLWDTPEYKHLRNLEHVSLCDTVSVYFPQLAVMANAKVVKTSYDCLLERYDYIELGSVRQNISDKIAAVSEQLSRTVDEKELRIYQNEVSALLADKVSTNELTAFKATVTTLIADKASIEDLTAYEAKITVLLADKASVDELYAVEAKISNLDAQYAQIDFANVDTALISAGFAEQFLVSQGLIADAVTASSAQITGYLTGVGIVANSIKTGTLDAGNITVTNLNCASLTVGQINGHQIASGAVSLENLDAAVASSITTALEEAGLAKETAEQCRILVDEKCAVYYQASQPSGGTYSKNDIWFDTDDGNKMYRWDGSKWVAATFGESALAASSVTAEKIAAGAIVAGKIASGAVTADKIAAGAITAAKIASGTITADQIATGTITAAQIAAGTITTKQIASGTITGDNIAAKTITGDNLVARTITATQIAASTITSNEIAANTITASNIKAGTITSAQIAAGTITAANLASDVLTVGNISGFLPAVQAAIDGIDIGGRNLVRLTLTPKITQYTNTRPNLNGVAPLSGNAGTRYAVEHGMGIVNTDATWTRFYFGTSSVDTGSLLGLIPGQPYTLSCDVRWKQLSAATNTTTYYMRACLYEDAITTGKCTNTQYVDFGTITPAQRGTEMSARCEFTFTVSDTSTILFIAVQCSDTTATHFAVGDFIELANIKIEKGNKATDWTPAPEDVESITTINDVIADWCYANDTTYINGGKIYTGTISADKINVTDLRAFGATIGGFTISASAIYTKAGTFADTAQNIYIGSSGISLGTAFSVTPSGVMNASSATITGTITTASGDYKTTLNSGGMNLYYNETWYGRFSSGVWTDAPTNRGVVMSARTAATYLLLGKYDENLESTTAAYIINYGLNPNGNTERHIFYSTTRFLSTVYTNAPIVMANNYAYKAFDTSGTSVSMLWLNSSNSICLYDTTHVLYLGYTGTATYLRGSAITVSGSTTFGSAVTFNSTVQCNSALTFKNGYGVRFTDTNGEISYVLSVNSSNQVTLKSTTMDLFVYGLNTYLGSTSYPTYVRGSSVAINSSTVTINGKAPDTVYIKGEIISCIAFVYGYVTSTSTSLVLFFPLARSLASGATAKCTSATAANLRSVNGTYVGGSGGTLTSYITSTTARTGGIQITFTNSSGWGVTNNTPVAGYITLSITLS